MDLYLADYNFVPQIPLDKYESFVWTERYSAFGDFKIVTEEMPVLNLNAYPYLMSPASNRVMMLENIDAPKKADGKSLITLSGRSVEASLENKNNKSGSLKASEQIFGYPGDIARYIVNRYCVTVATAGAVNVVPGLSSTAYDNGTAVTMLIERGDIYGRVKLVCDAYDLGFMVRRGGPGETKLVFHVYKGSDLSDRLLPGYTEYSLDDGTLSNVSTLESNATHKNHVRVLGATGAVDVYAPGTPTSVSGFERRTMVIDASDVTGNTAADLALLREKGAQALAEPSNRYVKLIDGEVARVNWSNFALGSVVKVSDKLGTKTSMRITEKIWSVDGTGTQCTPTFQVV